MGNQDVSGFYEVPAAWLLKGVTRSPGFSRVKIRKQMELFMKPLKSMKPFRKKKYGTDFSPLDLLIVHVLPSLQLPGAIPEAQHSFIWQRQVYSLECHMHKPLVNLLGVVVMMMMS